MRRPFAGGYDFAVDPNLPGGEAPLFWSPHLDPSVVILTAAPTTFTSAHDVSDLEPSFRRVSTDGDHQIARDHHQRHRLVLTGGAAAATPVAAVIPLDANFVLRAQAALRLWRTVTGQSRDHPQQALTPHRHQRLVLALRALDGRSAAASYRELAQGLFGNARVPVGPSWKTHDLRDRTIRLVRTGMKLMQGEYLDLLQL